MKPLHPYSFLLFCLVAIGSELAFANEFQQPIPFSHKTHAGENEIACEFCHVYARRSINSGAPSMQSCAGCHKTILGSTPEKQEGITSVLQYWKENRVIPWKKVHDVPDFVYFSHKRHIRAGYDCTECHGEVGTLDLLSLDTMAADLSMGWCVRCHTTEVPAHQGKIVAPVRLTRGGKIQPDAPPVADGTIWGPSDCLACHK